jgi:glycosyltransferase involved in cell wall biosynthesis
MRPQKRLSVSPTPLVSVVLPTYNRKGTLDRAIRSVLDQTFRDFELIVVDDGSTDESRGILEQYARRARVRLISSTHRGCAVARNLGITASTAPLIAFQDSDDEWLPDKLEKAVAALSSAHGAEVFYSDMVRVHQDGSVSRCEWIPSRVSRGVLISEKTLDYQVTGVGLQAAVMMRKCFEQVGLFDEGLTRLIDLELFVRLSDHFEFRYGAETLVRYYEGPGISTDTWAMVQARRYLIRKYRKRLRARKHHLAYQYLLLADAHRENGSWLRSQVLAAAVLLGRPEHPRVRAKATHMLRVASRRRFSSRTPGSVAG